MLMSNTWSTLVVSISNTTTVLSLQVRTEDTWCTIKPDGHKQKQKASHGQQQHQVQEEQLPCVKVFSSLPGGCSHATEEEEESKGSS